MEQQLYLVEYLESDTTRNDVGAISYIFERKRLRKAQRVYLPFKRLMDIVLSLLALVVLAPFMLVVAIVIKLDSRGPVLFKQQRVGKDGVPFTMFKFRSMGQDAEKKLMNSESFKNRSGSLFIEKPEDDPRITRVGRIIRKTSIDELPQFANCLLGNMSLVGPRPLAVYEHEAMNAYQRQRALVKPGLTCFWQVSGRSNLSEQERVELDIRYIREQGFLTDMTLLFKTIPALVTEKGAY